MKGKTFKQFWKERGLSAKEVDAWTEDLDTDIHRAITDSGWWDDQLLGRIAAAENLKHGRLLSKGEVKKLAQQLLDEIAGWGK